MSKQAVQCSARRSPVPLPAYPNRPLHSLESAPPRGGPPPPPAAARSVPMLATALQRHLHWNQQSTISRWWHRLDDNYLRPMFGGRPKGGAAAADYHSPPNR